MSYFIEYDRKVIKTTRGFIFMLLGGDNNVTETKWVGGKKKWAEVRARSWFHYNHEILEAPKDTIMAFCESCYGGDPEYQVHMKGGKWICQKDMHNYFLNGIRRAQSLEQIILANRGQTLDASVRHWPDKDSICSITELSRCLRTTQELEDWLDLAKPLREKYLADGKDCYICLSFCGEKPLVYGCADNAGEVVVKTTSRKNPGYVSDYIAGRQISFTNDLEKALVFDSEEAARAAIGNCWKNIKFVSLASQRKADKPKPFLLLFGAGKLGGTYLSRTARNTVYGCLNQDGAKKFASENEVIRYAHYLREKGWDENRCGKFTMVNSEDGSRTVLHV